MATNVPYADSYTALTAYTHDYDPNKQALKGRLGGQFTTLYDLYGRSRNIPAPEVEHYTSKGFSLTYPTIAMTGTAISGGVTEAQIITGGETIILTLTSGTWAASGSVFDALRQGFLDGLTSSSSGTYSFRTAVAANCAVTDVVRTSSTIVTITLDAAATYGIVANDTVTVTIPSGAVVYSNGYTAYGTFQPATPTFTVTAVTNLFSALVGAKFQVADTYTRDSTDVPMIGGVSDKIVTGNVGLSEGWYATTLTSVSANTTYTVSELVYAPNGATLTIQVDGFTSGDVYVESYNTNFVGTGAVQHVSVTFTTGATVVKLRPLVLTITSTQGITFYVGSGNSGLMGETGAVANPYTATSRSAGRAQMPWDAGLYTGAMGSVAVLFRAGYASTAAINPTLFAHGPDNNNGLRFDYRDATDSFTMRRANAGSSGEKASSASSHAVGDYVFAVGVWTPTGLAASRNGEASLGTVTADTNIPTLSGSADVGGNANVFSGRELTGDAAWVALFRYPMVNSEAAAIYNAFGQSGRPKPTIRSLDQVARGAHATAVFDGRGQVFDRRIAS